MRLDVLGPTQLTGARGGAVTVGGGRPKALLAALAARAGHAVPVGALADAISAGGATISLNNVQVQVASLRRRAGYDLIVTDGEGYRLGAHVELAHLGFLADVAAAGDVLATDPRTAGDQASRALSRWRGEPLPDCDDPVSDEVRRSLTAARVAALETVARARLATGDPHGAAEAAATLTAEDPLGERWWELRLRALRAAGRRADAMLAYDTLRRMLASELGTAPSASLQLLHQQLLAEERSRGGVLWPGDVPPPLDEFVGRDAELAELGELLAGHRLVALVGPGGAGKTRLAREHVARRSDLVRVVVACGAARTRIEALELVAARVLVGPPEGTLSTALAAVLRPMRPLLVLDNLEQVDGAGELVTGLLDEVPGLRILATTRQPLGVPTEAVLRVAGLAGPLGDEAAEVLGSAAGKLFVIRARAAYPAFRLVGRAADVAAICRGLDGLPLGLELAAARMQLYPPEELADYLGSLVRAPRVDATGAAGTGGDDRTARHVSVLATVDWSYRLLDQEAARLLRHLSVFDGSASVAAVSAVVALPPSRARDLLDELVRRSLAVREPAGRFRLLNTVRLVARDKLGSAGEQYEAVSRLDAWCLQTCRDLVGAAELPGFADSAEAIAFFDVESVEIRSALSRLADVDLDRWAGLLIACWGPWWQLGRTGDLVALLERALEVLPATHRLRADVALRLGVLDANEGRLRRAAQLLDDVLDSAGLRAPQEALARIFRAYVCLQSGEGRQAELQTRTARTVAERSGSLSLQAWALLMQGAAENRRGDVGSMVRSHEEALRLARTGGAAVVELGALTNLSANLTAAADETAAAPLRAEALALAGQLRYAELEASLVADEARAALAAGRLGDARLAADRCATSMLRVSHGRWLAGLVELQAGLAAAEGDHARAVALASAARPPDGPRRCADGAGHPLVDLVRLGMGCRRGVASAIAVRSLDSPT